MLVIGEKINGFGPRVGQAIARRDADFIGRLAREQLRCGADVLDLCAGPKDESASLAWLVDTVQAVADAPLSLDSADPGAILAAMPRAKTPGFVNSVSGEGDKAARLLPAAAKAGWKVIALCCDDRGIPADPAAKLEIARALAEQAGDCGIEGENLYIDPLVTPLSTDSTAAAGFLAAVRGIAAALPGVHFTCGLSNISYGMPLRGAVNGHFLNQALTTGLDSAILDPTQREVTTALAATRALLGQDKHCRGFLGAYRKGLLG